ncbi:retrovirus-related pol polyprotein from transposon TNT 1-94 [Tanacetum coccineum]
MILPLKIPGDLLYQGLEYTDADIADFEERLERIYSREIHRVQVVDFQRIPELMRDSLFARMVMEHRDDVGVVVFTSRAWGRLFDTRGPLVLELILEFLSTLRFGVVLLDLDAPDTIQFQLGGARRRLSWRQFILALGLHTGEEMKPPVLLGPPPSYTLIRDSVLRLFHRIMAHSIAGRSQALEKVTVTDLFYLKGLDVRLVNIPYLLARYLRREILQGLTFIAPALSVIDMAELELMKDLQCLKRGIIFPGKVDSEGFWITSLKTGRECGIRYKMALIKDPWLMHGSEITTHVRHSRLMDEFDKLAAKEGESLDSVHERSAVSYDVLYDSLVQFEPRVLASRAKKAAKNHDPLAPIAHSNASSSHSHANSSYSPQSYYVTHPPSIVDYDDEYQGELQGDSQEDNLTTAMMLLARAIYQKFSTPTNNRLCISFDTRNQAMVQDGRVDIQTKNVGYGRNANKNAGRNRTQGFNTGNAGDESNQIIQRVPRTESTPGKANVQCYNCNEKGHYARECQKPKVHDAKYFREQMLLAIKDEAGSNLSNEENDFMLDTSYGEDLEELTAAVMLMARLQPADDNAENVPSYDAKVVSQSIQTIHMLGKKPNKVYDPFLKAGLGYTNPERLKKAIAAQPKMYDGDLIHSNKLVIHSTDSEDAEESQNKMRHKMVQIDYEKLNALYETFVPQQELSVEQTYFFYSFNYLIWF